MAGLVRVRRLSEREGWKLQGLALRGGASTARFRKAILPAAAGEQLPLIARLLQTDEGTVRCVLHKINDLGQTATRRPAEVARPHPRAAPLPALAQPERLPRRCPGRRAP